MNGWRLKCHCLKKVRNSDCWYQTQFFQKEMIWGNYFELMLRRKVQQYVSSNSFNCFIQLFKFSFSMFYVKSSVCLSWVNVLSRDLDSCTSIRHDFPSLSHCCSLSLSLSLWMCVWVHVCMHLCVHACGECVCAWMWGGGVCVLVREFVTVWIAWTKNIELSIHRSKHEGFISMATLSFPSCLFLLSIQKTNFRNLYFSLLQNVGCNSSMWSWNLHWFMLFYDVMFGCWSAAQLR